MLNYYQVTRDGRTLNLGGKCSVPVQQGDMFRLQTPGGGGYGPVQVNFIIIYR